MASFTGQMGGLHGDPVVSPTLIESHAQATWDDWAKKSPLAKRAVDSQKAWLRELGLLA